MSEKTNRKKRSLIATLLLTLIALLGFSSCTKPEEITDEGKLERNDSIGDIRLMYGVTPRYYNPHIKP